LKAWNETSVIIHKIQQKLT